MTNYDAIDDILSEVTGAVASVRVNTQLWLGQMYGFPARFHGVQVKVVLRKCQGLVPLEYVQPLFQKVQALLKHLLSTMAHTCSAFGPGCAQGGMEVLYLFGAQGGHVRDSAAM